MAVGRGCSRVAQPGTVLDLREMTEAAIWEVGANASVTWHDELAGTIIVWSATATDRAIALRAGWIASIAARGADALVSCSACAVLRNGQPVQNCILPLDALRGRTCKENP